MGDQKNGVRAQNTSPQPIIYFRHKKYRFVPQYLNFLAVHFSQMIAETLNFPALKSYRNIAVFNPQSLD